MKFGLVGFIGDKAQDMEIYNETPSYRHLAQRMRRFEENYPEYEGVSIAMFTDDEIPHLIDYISPEGAKDWFDIVKFNSNKETILWEEEFDDE